MHMASINTDEDAMDRMGKMADLDPQGMARLDDSGNGVNLHFTDGSLYSRNNEYWLELKTSIPFATKTAPADSRHRHEED